MTSLLYPAIALQEPPYMMSLLYPAVALQEPPYMMSLLYPAVALQEPPYMMKKKSDQMLVGNDQFEGFCVDIFKEIADILGFRYTFYLVPDYKYGAKEKNEWTGMVRELMDKVSSVVYFRQIYNESVS